MTFSIVIPTYNGAQFIAQAIESAINQTRPADEIIISDDNSSDCTLDICMKFGNKIKIYTNPQGPSGFVNGWNNAIAHASSEYVSILHQDDLLSPTFLEEAEKALRTYPYVKHLFSLCKYIDKNNEQIGFSHQNENPINIKEFSGKEYVYAYLHIGKPHIHRCPGVITQKDLLKKCVYRSEAGHIADDDFFLRVGQYTNVIGILKPLSSYRIHDESETGHLGDKQLVKRLIKDYTFQINHIQENSLLDEEQKIIFKKLKHKYSKRLLGYSLKSFQISDCFYAIKNLLF